VDSDQPDFAAWVDARRPTLWRTAWLLTGDHHRADDLVQTALLKVWPRWTRVTAAGDPEPYVRRVMYTTYLAWWHRRWKAELPTAQLPESAAVEDPRHVDLVTALAALPRGQRAVIVARFLDDLSVADTARELNVSEGTVKSQTARALANLRSSSLLSDERARRQT
jgi:RNA polymerase sigma-70 factor (sigma-E family)